MLEQDGGCVLDGSPIPTPLQMCLLSWRLRRGISCSPNLPCVRDPRILLYCSEQQDVELQIPSARGGGRKGWGCQQGGATDSESSIAHREACLYPINIRYTDVNDTGEPGPEQCVKSLQLRVVWTRRRSKCVQELRGAQSGFQNDQGVMRREEFQAINGTSQVRASDWQCMINGSTWQDWGAK